MDKEPVSRIGVSLPPKLLERFDALIDEMGYANRSEAIRDAVRSYMLKNELGKGEGAGVGVLSIIYDHDVRGVSDMLTDLQHGFHELIRSSTHIHLDKHNCMELVIIRGDIKKIKEIKNKLTTVSGVKSTELIITSLGDALAGEDGEGHSHAH